MNLDLEFIDTSGEYAREENTEFKKIVNAQPVNDDYSLQDILTITSFYHNLVEQLPEFIITESAIHLYSQEEIESLAVCRIQNAAYEGPDSVNDPRMGVIDRRKLCQTCGLGNFDCDGHLGYIVLNHPIYHPLFLRELISILSSVCRYCSQLLLTKEHIMNSNLIKLPYADRLKQIEKESEKVTCQNHSHVNISKEQIEKIKKTGSAAEVEALLESLNKPNTCRLLPKPTYLPGRIKETHQVMYREGNDTQEQPMSIKEVKEILEAIPEEDARILGFANGSKPVNLVLTVLPVTPPNTRPPNLQGGVQKYNKTTDKYVRIMKANMQILNPPDKKKAVTADELFNHIDDLFERNDKSAVNSGDYFKSFKDFIQGKKGLIRRLLMSKRGNNNCRTVIDPDPTLKYGEVRLPRDFAYALSAEEYINDGNIDVVRKMLLDGKITHLIHKFGVHLNNIREIDLNNTSKFLQYVRVGDCFRRKAEDGDFVVMNRQPTLHKYGIMAMNAKFASEKGNELSIGFHPSYAKPFNADADGDEANIYGMPSFESQAEGGCVMHVRRNIMSTGTGRNAMGLEYDNITGCYKMTADDVMVDVRLWNKCIRKITRRSQLESLPERLKRYGIKMYSGKALFSALLPVDFFYEKDGVVIKEGILVKGRIQKKHVGPLQARTIVQMLNSMYPPTWGESKRTSIESVAADFITDGSYVATEWLTENCVSIGVRDCTFRDEKKAKAVVGDWITDAKNRVREIKKESKFINPEYIEQKINTILGETKNMAIKMVKEVLEPTNSMVLMSDGAGTKGDIFNISQSFALIGQQNFRGERVKKSISNGRRTIAHFPMGADTVESRGFCVHSFWAGLSPHEHFFHHSSGRESGIDLISSTPTTGQQYYRLIKAMDNFVSQDDTSIRNKISKPFTFCYGNDGFNAGQLVDTKYGSSFIDIASEASRINSNLGWIKA